MLSRIKNAAGRTRVWLLNVSVRSRETMALQHLGLFLCDQIRKHNSKFTFTESERKSIELPKVTSLMGMSRDELLILTKEVNLSSPKYWFLSENEQRNWAQIMGGLAISYARSGDVVVVAALVRSAARMGLQDIWLYDAQTHLLDLQQPNGTFGLLARELTLLNDNVDEAEVLLRLTVEVLWALFEVSRNIDVKITS